VGDRIGTAVEVEAVKGISLPAAGLGPTSVAVAPSPVQQAQPGCWQCPWTLSQTDPNVYGAVWDRQVTGRVV